jgi:hypothetical protein
MTFKVDPAALDGVAALLRRNGACVLDIHTYITSQLEKGVWEQLGGQGLPEWFIFNHDELIARAHERLDWVASVWHSADVNFAVSAEGYRRTDVESAARMDAQVVRLASRPQLNTDRTQGPLEARDAASFRDLTDPLTPLGAGPPEDVGGMEPKAVEIAQWVGKVNDVVSMNWWIRNLIKEIFGRDPIEEVLQLFSGDWRVYARYAHAWVRVGGAVRNMTHNIELTDDVLASSWSGNAADAGLLYLERLRGAMEVEHSFYNDYLFGVCKAYLELAYWGYEILDYYVGELLDLLLESIGIFSGIFTEGWGAVIDALTALVDGIMFIIDFFRQIYHGYKAVAGLMGMPEESPFEIQRLLLADPDPSGINCVSPPIPR